MTVCAGIAAGKLCEHQLKACSLSASIRHVYRHHLFPKKALMLVGRQEGHPACKNMGDGGHWLVWMEWRPAGSSVFLSLLIFPCTMKSRSSLLALAHPCGLGKRAVKRLWCGGGDLNG